MQKVVEISSKGKTSGNWQMDRIFTILKKKLTPGVILTLPRGYIYAYDHCSQTQGLYICI